MSQGYTLECHCTSSRASMTKLTRQSSVMCYFYFQRSSLAVQHIKPFPKCMSQPLHTSAQSKSPVSTYTTSLPKTTQYHRILLSFPPNPGNMPSNPWASEEEYFKEYMQAQTFRYSGQQDFPRGPLPGIRSLGLPGSWPERGSQRPSPSGPSGYPGASGRGYGWNETGMWFGPGSPPR